MREIQRTISRAGQFIFQLMYPQTFSGEFRTFEEAEQNLKLLSYYSTDQEILENYNAIQTDKKRS